MLKSSYKPRLHNRIITISIIVATVGSVIYSVLLWTIVDGLEEAMFSTLVGHEIDEVVLDLAADKDAVLPHSGSLGVYLLTREDDQFIPDYLRSLESGSYREISNAGRKYFVAILDIYDDRLYMSFDITHLSSYSNALFLLLIGGGTLSIIIILIIGAWISRKVLLPVSTLAEEVAGINPNERQVRVEEKYRGYEVGLIAGSIDQFMNKMDEYVEREQSFTAAVSHELRTSIAVIFTSAELLEMGGGLEGAHKDTLSRI